MNTQRLLMTQAMMMALAWSSLSAPVRAADGDLLANYYDNTWIWKNQDTNASGRIWFNRDGKYYVFFNMGPQPKPPTADGPFQVEGRAGTFTVRSDFGYPEVCLWPGSPRTLLGAEKQQELFAESSCYRITPHNVGDIWNESADPKGHNYKMWLVKGR